MSQDIEAGRGRSRLRASDQVGQPPKIIGKEIFDMAKATVCIATLDNENGRLKMAGSRWELQAVRLKEGGYHVHYRKIGAEKWRKTKLLNQAHVRDFFFALT